MKLRELLAYAVKAKAAEIQIAANAPMKIRIGPNVKQINMPPLNASDFKEMVLDHLSAPAKEALQKVGRCEDNIDIEGLGRFRAIVEGQKARLMMPSTTRQAAPPAKVSMTPHVPHPATPASESDSDLAPGQVPTFGQKLRALFGGKK